MPMHIVTPLTESIPLGNMLNKNVYLKLECVQTAGSFKIRGIGKYCQELYDQGCRTFICPSSGNAGYATAWAARVLGAKALIVAPEGTTQDAITAIQSLGGEVMVYGEVWDLSNIKAQELAKELPNAAYITSYDHPSLWDGYGTMIDEIRQQCPVKPDGILLSVGGGGMMSGILQGLDRNGWSDVPVIGCGTHGANAFAETVKAGRHVKLDKTRTLVHCISATEVTPHIVDELPGHTLLAHVTSDTSACIACERFLDDHRLLVDPACGVTLSALYENSPLLKDMKNIVVIICGGVGITYRELMETKAAAMEKEAK